MRRPGQTLTPAAAARGSLGHGLRGALQHRRRLRPLPAREGRPAVRARLASRRCAASATGCARTAPEMSRLSLRVRLTLVFATVMAVVLAAMAFFVYARVGDALASSIDQSLRLQASEIGTDLGDEDSLVDRDTTAGPRLAQLLGAGGSVLRSTPAGLPPLLSGAAAARVAAGNDLVETTHVAGRTGDWRLLAVPVRSGGRPRALVFLASLASREQTLHRLFVEFLFAGPIALLLAALAGYGLAAAALRPVESMRYRAAAITAATPGRRLPVPPRAGRDRAPCRDAERDARPARVGLRARAPLRGRRQPRAAHAAGAPAHRAGSCAAPPALEQGAGGRTSLGGRGDRAADPADRGSTPDRPCRAGPPADRARAGAGDRAPEPRRGAVLRPGRGAGSRDRRRRDERARRYAATRLVSSRRSATSSTTRSCTAPARSSCPCARTALSSTSTFATRAPAFRSSSRHGRSTVSAAPTTHAAAAARASVFRSSI